MIIFEPRTGTSDHGTVALRARVESRVPAKDGSQDLVFEYPLQASDWITQRADPFVAALVLRAMNVGEDIEVRAPLSTQLARGLEQYQSVLASWFPHRLAPIRIRAPLEPAPVRPGGAVLTAFSGGVDSFYTLRAHAGEHEPDVSARITHALFVYGFDLPLGRAEAAYDVARSRYAEMLGRLGIELVAARSNIQSFVPRKDWGLFHGSSLLASALALGDGVRRFYVPATHTWDHLVPYGSDPRIDPLLRTEAMEIVHDGADVTRVQKTAAIGAWPPTFGHLRVCVSYDPATPNCCRCEKCARTMMTLDLLGMLERQTSFPRPLQRDRIRACRYRNRSDLPWPRQILAAAVERRRWDLALDLMVALGLSIPAFVRRTLTYRFLRLRALVPGLRPGPASYLP
jgi:hypothetical protein